MNVRLTPHGQPHRTDMYSGVGRVYSDGQRLFLGFRAASGPRRPTVVLAMGAIALIVLDEDGGSD